MGDFGTSFQKMIGSLFSFTGEIEKTLSSFQSVDSDQGGKSTGTKRENEF